MKHSPLWLAWAALLLISFIAVGTRAQEAAPAPAITPPEVVQRVDAVYPPAALAARHASDAQIEVLERLLDDEAALPESDSAMHAEINKQFHAAIYRAAHNRYVLRSLQSMQDAIQRLQTTTFSWPGRPAKALREHRAIMRAITKRDPGAAEQAARAHMREALRYRMLLRHKRS